MHFPIKLFFHLIRYISLNQIKLLEYTLQSNFCSVWFCSPFSNGQCGIFQPVKTAAAQVNTFNLVAIFENLILRPSIHLSSQTLLQKGMRTSVDFLSQDNIQIVGCFGSWNFQWKPALFKQYGKTQDRFLNVQLKRRGQHFSIIHLHFSSSSSIWSQSNSIHFDLTQFKYSKQWNYFWC